MTEFLVVFCSAIGGSALILLSIDWSVHRKMTVDNCNTWDYGNFEAFKKQYSTIDWKRRDQWSDSVFDYQSDSEIHASIIKFKGKGMVLTPFSYLQYWFWHRKHVHRCRKDNRSRGLWKQS